MKNIYCIVGPSGSGKTTLVNALADKYGYKVIESYTTRPPRYEGEVGHIFVSPEEFKALGEMCAYTKFDGNEYGVTADLIEQNDLYVIDPAGVDFLRQKYSGSKGVKVIGLTADVDVLKQRMKKRGDSDEKIEKRLANDAKAFQGFGKKTDTLISANSSVASICEYIHEFIDFNERHAAIMHEFSLIDADGRVVSSGKRFYDAEMALEALKDVYPDGLPSGWRLRDDTAEKQADYVDAIHKCNPSFKKSFINVNIGLLSVSSVENYAAVPFTYKGKEYVYREHLCEGWIERVDEALKKPASRKLALNDIIKDAKTTATGGKKPTKKALEKIL